jgi:hypothetical protein
MPGPTVEDSIYHIARTNIQGGTSPWVYFTEFYPDGTRGLLYTNATHAFKLIDKGNQIVVADSIQLSFNPISSFLWGHVLASNGNWYVSDTRFNPDLNQYGRIFLLKDSDPNDPYSDLQIESQFDYSSIGVFTQVSHLNMNYNGELVFITNSDTTDNTVTVGILSSSFQLKDTLKFQILPNEIASHNAYAIDENNSFYAITTHRVVRFDWDGIELSIGYSEPYDFVDDGPTGQWAEGSGTTPTLMGFGTGNDQLVIMTDGHANNNLVAFWRELPPNWSAVPGMPLHFADSIQLPAAVSTNNLFQSIENSPCVLGYSAGIAQFNGFLGQPCPTQKGVQKVTWDTTTNQFVLDWYNDSVNFNGVPVVSSQTGLMYGSGRGTNEDCSFYYYGLNWDTGDVEFSHYLGEESSSFLSTPWNDAGVNNVIDEFGNIYFSGDGALVKIGIFDQSTSISEQDSELNISIYPNPSNGLFNIKHPSEDISFRIHSITGKLIEEGHLNSNISLIDITSQENGVYIIEFIHKKTIMTRKLVVKGLK